MCDRVFLFFYSSTISIQWIVVFCCFVFKLSAHTIFCTCKLFARLSSTSPHSPHMRTTTIKRCGDGIVLFSGTAIGSLNQLIVLLLQVPHSPSSSPFHWFWKTGNLDFIESPPTTQVPHQLKFYLISRDRTSNKSVLQYFVGYFFSLICLPVRVQKEPNNKPCVQSTKESHLNSRDHLGYVHGWKSKKTTTHDLKTSSWGRPLLFSPRAPLTTQQHFNSSHRSIDDSLSFGIFWNDWTL